jgi:arylsulfatase A-like enzyme
MRKDFAMKLLARRAPAATRWVLLVIALAALAGAAPAQTNFVFFLVDDLGWRDLGCFGSSFYETPNIDALAAGGMRFTQAYAACPVCSPTRSSIMTGKYPIRTGITDFINPAGGNQPDKWPRSTKFLPARYNDRLALDEVTIAEALREGGYATFFAGKWHLGPQGFWPEDQGFDINKGGTEQGGPYGGDKYFSPYGNPRLEDGPRGEHLPDRLASETVRFLEANRERRFLAYLSFYSVHTPLMARPDLEAKYAAKAKRIDFAGPRFLVERASEARQVQDHAVYAGMVEAMDLAVGKVLDALQRLNLAGNTVVILMSDNGGLSTSEGSPTSNIPLRAGKGWMYEGGIREPLIIRAPGITKPGSVCSDAVISTDFYPTMLDLARLPARPQQHLDGVSLLALLRGGSLEPRPLFWHYPHYGNQGGRPAGAVREGDWKLIDWYEDAQPELFNLRGDLSEKYNLVRLHPEKAQQMQSKLAAWRTRLGATMPAPNPRYQPE